MNERKILLHENHTNTNEIKVHNHSSDIRSKKVAKTGL